MARVFISYKRADKDKVFPLKDKIEAAIGEPCWVDLDGIESDAQFVDVIAKAINAASVFLFMYSKQHSKIENFEDDWTMREFNLARKKKKHIALINIDAAPLTDSFELLFGLKQQIDATSQESWNKLLIDLQNWLNVTNITSSEPTVDDLLNRKPHWYHYAFLFYILAKMGLNVARCKLGDCFYFGKGVKQDYEEAFMWYSKALYPSFKFWVSDILEKFEYCYVPPLNKNALYKTGRCYFYGHGVDKDYESAVSFFQSAAEQGHAEAQYYLGVCYYEGKGTNRNPKLAKSWLEKAAKQNCDIWNKCCDMNIISHDDSSIGHPAKHTVKMLGYSLLTIGSEVILFMESMGGWSKWWQCVLILVAVGMWGLIKEIKYFDSVILE